MRPRWVDPPDGDCDVCRIRPATRWWGDAMTLNHGGGQRRCDVCVYGEQLRHAAGRTLALPGLLWRYLRARATVWSA